MLRTTLALVNYNFRSDLQASQATTTSSSPFGVHSLFTFIHTCSTFIAGLNFAASFLNPSRCFSSNTIFSVFQPPRALLCASLLPALPSPLRLLVHFCTLCAGHPLPSGHQQHAPPQWQKHISSNKRKKTVSCKLLGKILIVLKDSRSTLVTK